jgi:hypothetical protein
MDEHYKKKIADEFLNCIRNTVSRINARTDEREANNNPFQNLLLPKEAIFWSRFERSFSTSFGQRAVETISKYVALATGAEAASTQKVVDYSLAEGELNNIANHIDALRNNVLGRAPNWDSDFQLVQVPNPVRSRIVRSNFDLWYQREGIDHYLTIKTVKPNIDQTATAKQELLRIKTAFPDCRAYFGMYYNPYGEDRVLYDHSPPFKIFNMREDSVVLIGRDYWDTVGCPGTYEEVLAITNGVSEEARRIMEKYISEQQ